MTTRNRSIRTKIVALVSVPLVALLALWIFATSLTVGPAFNLLSANTLLDTVGRPGETLVGELQRERRLTVVQLSGPADTPRTALLSQRAATDRAAADFRAAAGGEQAQDAAGATLRERIRQLFADLDQLNGNRQHIDARQLDVIGAQHLYDAIVNTGFAMFAATARFGDERVDREIRALTSVGRGQEYLSRADSLLAGGATAGELDEALRDDLLQSIITSRFLFTEGVADMPAEERTAYQRMRTSDAFRRLNELQTTLITDSRSGEPAPIAPADWQAAYDTAAQQLRAFELNATDALAERATPVAVTVLVRLAIAGLLGLVALIVSLVVSVRLGRSIIGRLRTLRGEALEMAGARLPDVVRRLRRGESVDVDAETPPLEYGEDEIGEVGHAFTDVQRTAVQSAVEEAALRKGINEVFLNIARRSQTLLHRQLALLDRMERRETEPDELEDLYRVDHLATRMRRHAEDLVILAGAAPGRGWRNPVPLIDVIRGAISEVEDYKRIDLPQVASAAIVGRSVGDVIHLLAELLENAASFSPPDTRVTVTGQDLPNGYAIEIEDRGLGMSPEAVEEANRKLAEPPDFDPQDSARLGLFVVSRLAHRTGVRVSLRSSPYGGVTAVVLVPGDLVTEPPERRLALPAGPSAGTAGSWDRPSVQWLESGVRKPANGTTVPRPRTAPDAEQAGPTRSAPNAGLTAEGLVKRRRTVPRPAAEAVPESTPDGLPRRRRQASLAPQLRDTPADEQAGGPLRSPEQVRQIMSALQKGTARGRQEAAAREPATDPTGQSFAEAATVHLPVVRDDTDRDGA